jgi:hypothetical protein
VRLRIPSYSSVYPVTLTFPLGVQLVVTYETPTNIVGAIVGEWLSYLSSNLVVLIFNFLVFFASTFAPATLRDAFLSKLLYLKG